MAHPAMVIPQSTEDADVESDHSDEDDSAGVQQDSASYKSREWMFTGVWKFLYDVETEFQQVYLPRIPFKVQHMIIYVKNSSRRAGNEFCTDVRGYLSGKRAPRSVWDAWLNHKLSWTPVVDIALNKDYQKDCARVDDVTSTWRVLLTYGKYKHFRVLGKAFRFRLSVDVDVPSDNENPLNILDTVKNKFILISGGSDDDFFLGKGIKYMEVLCNLLPLTRTTAEDVGRNLNVDVAGFVQCKQCDLRKWQTWIHAAEWTLLRGGLVGNPDYAQLHMPTSTWETIYTVGSIGRTTAGISAKLQASGIPTPSFISVHHSLPHFPSLSLPLSASKL